MAAVSAPYRVAPAVQVAPRPPDRAIRTPAPLLSVVVVNFRQWENTVALTHQQLFAFEND